MGDLGSGGRRLDREAAKLAISIGAAFNSERRRRGMTLRELAVSCGLSSSTLHRIESGEHGSIDAYVRIADALRLRPEFSLIDPRRRESTGRGPVDIVHAAMGEALATHLRALDLEVGLDEPYQHYQFAGRADLVAWSLEPATMLHIENRTRFPDIQATFGSFNSKRRYLGAELATRAGVARWQSETHVMVALWSAEVLRELRSHRVSFASVCPDTTEGFEAWWSGKPPSIGRRSILVAFDPIGSTRFDRRNWASLEEAVGGARPRYRDYAGAAAAISDSESQR